MSRIDVAMHHIGKNGLLIGALILGALVSVLSLQNATLKREKSEVLRSVRYAHRDMWIPDFVAPTVDGKSIRIGGGNGKRQVLVFLSPTCKYCIQSMPFSLEMDRFARTYNDLEVVGLTRSNDAAMAGFIVKQGIKFPVAVIKEDRLINLLKFGPTRPYSLWILWVRFRTPRLE